MKPTYQTVGGHHELHTAHAARAPRFARGALLFLALATGTARADEPATTVADEAPVPLPAEEPAPVASARELVELGRVRLDTGDEEGARIVLLDALSTPGVDADEATYLLAMAWELGGDPAQALALYDEGLARWPQGARAADRTYRRAEAFAAMGRPAEALAALERLEAFPLDEGDEHKVALCEATWTLETGRSGPGLRMLRDALGALDAGELPWQQARGRAALARWIAAEADDLDLDASERQVVKRLERRLLLVQRVEKEATAIALLDQPEWVLDSVLTLGGAYEALAHSLSTHRRPARLSAAQLEIYEAAVAEKVGAADVKALRAYDLGLEMAVRIGWTGARVDRLQAARDALAARLGA